MTHDQREWWIGLFSEQGGSCGARADSSGTSAGGEAGFTLVEVIVALAILALSAGIVIGMISSALHRGRQAERLAEATSLAQSVLARVGVELPLQEGSSTGRSDRMRWQLRIAAYGDASDRQHWPVGAYTVSAEVYWNDGPGEQSIVLSTLRLGPLEPRK